MANPQQPELRRSGRGSTVQDSDEARADHSLPADDELPERTVPEDNRPGNRATQDDHQPDLDRFAERLGLRDDDEAGDRDA